MKRRKVNVLWLALGLAAGTWTIAQTVQYFTQTQSINLQVPSSSFNLPLDQTGGRQTFTLPSSSDVLIKLAPLENASVELTTPDGKTVTQENASSLGYEWHVVEPTEDLEGFIAPVRTLYIAKTAPVAGEYAVNVTTTAAAPSTMQVQVVPLGSELSAKPLVGTPGDNRTIYPQDQPLALHYFLYGSQGPLAQAAVTAQLTSPSGEKTTVTLKDDGIEPDGQAGDGLYTATVQPGSIGYWNVNFVATGETATSGRFNSDKQLSFAVDRPDLELSGTYQDQGVDLDGDGRFDAIEIAFNTQGTPASTLYGLSATLKLPSGRGLTSGTQFTPGQPAKVLFQTTPDDPTEPADPDNPSSLSELGFGTYEITNVILDTETTSVDAAEPLPRLLSQFMSVGFTKEYVASDMQRSATQILGWTSDHATDTDGNGKLDLLEVNVDVDVLTGDTYGVSADLVAANGTVIESVGLPYVSLTAGRNTVTLPFQGTRIGEVGQDGPYVLKDMTVYPQSGSGKAAFADVVKQSSAYRASAFEGYTPVIRATPKNIGQGITTAGRFKRPASRELKLLGGAQVTEQATVNAPNLSTLIPSPACPRILDGPVTWTSQEQVNDAFASSACLQISGNVHLGFPAKLSHKTLLVTGKGGLKANQGLEVDHSTVVTEHLHVNKSLIVVDSHVFSKDAKRDVILTGPTDLRGISSLVAGGGMKINGFLGSDLGSTADVMLVTGDDLTINANTGMSALIWSGGRTFLHGKLVLTGAILSKGDVQINKEAAITLQQSSANDLF